VGSRPASAFLDAATRRLGWFALMLACPPLAFLIGDAFLLALGKPSLTESPALAFGARVALATLSLAMFALTRLRRLSFDLMLVAGLVYEVLGAFLLSFRSYWGELSGFERADTVTWVGVWIVLFPLIVPVSPRRTAIAAVLAASTGPLVQAIWVLHPGGTAPSAIDLARVFAPLYVCGALQVGTSWLVYGLGRSISAAESRSKELGSYRLIERLGVGGMGEVWRAEHRMLARPAAIKLIRTELLSTESANDRASIVARFEREAQATAELRSPHTVSIFDYGVSDDGTLYYVMELLPGIDLETLVERFGPLPPERVVHLLSQACESLAEAHAHGLIHRDVKPANIYVCRLGLASDVIKVLDFGLVARARTASGRAHLTGSGFIVGTPRFLSPEQAAGKPVDERADIYALGCVGYWLLTGTPPFLAKNPGELIADHLRSRPESPSARLGTPVPERLERVLLACLEKDPSKRPLDAWSLLSQLQACGLDGWSASRARGWWDKNLKELAGPQPRSKSLNATTVVRAPAVPYLV
jgi:serine/threonine-protein kinase